MLLSNALLELLVGLIAECNKYMVMGFSGWLFTCVCSLHCANLLK